MTALLKIDTDYGLVVETQSKGTQIRATHQATFQPAFYDMQTGKIHISCFADGREAPVHILDAVPQEVAERADLNLVSGFVSDGVFLTRQQAAEKRVQR